MPVNITDWSHYLKQLTNHQHLLAHHVIKIINQVCTNMQNTQSQNINSMNNAQFQTMQNQLSINLILQVNQYLLRWDNALTPNQMQTWAQVINDLKPLDHILANVGEFFCLNSELIHYQDYPLYCADIKNNPHNNNPTKIDNLFDCLIYLENHLNQIIEN